MVSKKNKHYITASEIGQYSFCPVSWHLYQQGYRPDEQVFEKGNQYHDMYGKHIEQYITANHQSKWLYFIGILLIVFALLISLGRFLV